jgi:hypothetical protein
MKAKRIVKKLFEGVVTVYITAVLIAIVLDWWVSTDSEFLSDLPYLFPFIVGGIGLVWLEGKLKGEG